MIIKDDALLFESDIEVLVYVWTYNHEKYIEQCLDSIFSQITTFNYVVAICDDCSNDGNRNILIEIQKKHKDNCILVFEDEDQLALGNNNFYLKNIKRLPRAKYIALAEGDDFWCDNYKLQKQYECLNENNGNACFHLSKLFSDDVVDWTIIPSERIIDRRSSRLNSKDMIKYSLGEGVFFPINSYFIKASILYEIDEENFFWRWVLWDLAITLYCFSKERCYVIGEVCSEKRVDSEGSCSKHMHEKKTADIEKAKRHARCTVEQLREFDKLSEYKYHGYVLKECYMRIIRALAIERFHGKECFYISPYTGKIYSNKKIFDFHIRIYSHLVRIIKDESSTETFLLHRIEKTYNSYIENRKYDTKWIDEDYVFMTFYDCLNI